MLRYHKQHVILANDSRHTVILGHEKGIDVRLAIDAIRLAHQEVFDVAVLFSQDQDLSEVADEIRSMAKMQDRWIKVVSAFPTSPAMRSSRGIDRTDWIRFDKSFYDNCIDRRDYRPKARRQ